jgi:hypothetical protein
MLPGGTHHQSNMRYSVAPLHPYSYARAPDGGFLSPVSRVGQWAPQPASNSLKRPHKPPMLDLGAAALPGYSYSLTAGAADVNNSYRRASMPEFRAVGGAYPSPSTAGCGPPSAFSYSLAPPSASTLSSMSPMSSNPSSATTAPSHSSSYYAGMQPPTPQSAVSFRETAGQHQPYSMARCGIEASGVSGGLPNYSFTTSMAGLPSTSTPPSAVHENYGYDGQGAWTRVVNLAPNASLEYGHSGAADVLARGF